MDFTAENNFVLELCKFNSDNKNLVEKFLSNEDLNLPYILGQLQFNRIGGIAYSLFQKYGLLKKLNREMRNSLRTTYEQNCIKAQRLLDTEELLVEVFKDAPFKYALLKGAYLVQLYPNGFRTSNDIDVLIQEEDLFLIESKLKKFGFFQGNVRNDTFEPASRSEIISSRINRGETVPWIKEVNWTSQKFIEIDLNFSLDYKPNGSQNVVKSFLERSCMNIFTKVGRLPTLSTADFFIQLCTHLYKEATTLAWIKMKRDLSLYKFVDIYLFINEFFNAEFVIEIEKLVMNLGVAKECLYTLVRTKELFDINNSSVDKLIGMLSSVSEYNLNSVYDPQNNRFYQFDINFREWMFLSNRITALKEVKR